MVLAFVALVITPVSARWDGDMSGIDGSSTSGLWLKDNAGTFNSLAYNALQTTDGGNSPTAVSLQSFSTTGSTLDSAMLAIYASFACFPLLLRMWLQRKPDATER